MIEKILLAEDDLSTRKLVLYALKEYVVDVADNGQEAVDLFNVNQYDMVLMDIQMPVVDGIEASQVIRKIESEKQSKPRTVIMGMTAGWLPNLIDKCKIAGINDFLSKPFSPAELPKIMTDCYLRNLH
jgi:CheY-like chemotaxis protein